MDEADQLVRPTDYYDIHRGNRSMRFLQDMIGTVAIGIIIRRSDGGLLFGEMGDNVDNDLRGATVLPGCGISIENSAPLELAGYIAHECGIEPYIVRHVAELPRQAKSRYAKAPNGIRWMRHVFFLGFVNGSAEQLDARLKPGFEMRNLRFGTTSECYRAIHDHPESSNRHPLDLNRVIGQAKGELSDPRYCDQLALIVRNRSGEVLVERQKDADRFELPNFQVGPEETADDAYLHFIGPRFIHDNLNGQPSVLTTEDQTTAYFHGLTATGNDVWRGNQSGKYRWLDAEVLLRTSRLPDLAPILQ